MILGHARTAAALALELAALVVLGLALIGVAWLDGRSKPQVLVLVDRSHSVPRADSDEAVAHIANTAQAAGAARPQVVEFAGRPGAPMAPASHTVADLEPAATNIEAALEAALAAHARSPLAGVVVVSDGFENRGDMGRALRVVRDAKLPLHWVAVGRPAPQVRVVEVLAPDRVLVGQRLRVDVQVAGQLDKPLRVKATMRSRSGDTQLVNADAVNAAKVTVEFDAVQVGAAVVDVALEDPVSGQTFDALPDAAVIDVAPRAAILYAQGSGGTLARSLVQGGWSLDLVSAARLDAHADTLGGYQAVILDDVAIADASPRFWRSLVSEVKGRGLGLMVLGGGRSFARGSYRGSLLESVLPVVSEPAALDQAAAVVFAVDKSGSMGQGSGGVDRFQLAQRAVLETARGLAERDSLGLMVFDVVPRVLIPLAPAPAGIQALERDWPVRPNGGTKLAPALEAAVDQLERSAAPRRMLVIVTDGFVDDAPLAALRERLDRARIETIALAVGPDADIGALQRVVGAQAGLVRRVNQAAELPLVMRTALERRRAHIERGAIAVEQRLALPFSPGVFKDWPPVVAHFVTRSQAEATVAVQSQRGEPLIAFQRAGHGRVVAVTCGLGPWSEPWLQWSQWPRLAGGLADWISGSVQGDATSLSVSDLPAGLQVDADFQALPVRSGTEGISIAVDTPAAPGRALAAEAIAPGRLRATLPDAGPGLYTFVLSSPLGTQRLQHLRRQRTEDRFWGANPALDTWKAAGLVSDWDPAALARRHDDHRPRPVDRTLVLLGLALFLCGVLIDRTRLNVLAVVHAVRRRRTAV